MRAHYINQVFHTDCLDILRRLRAESGAQPLIDLIYIDPPFNSGADYQYLGQKAFSDQWRHTDYQNELKEIQKVHPVLCDYLAANESFFLLGHMAYLVMMAHRLYYMHALLNGTGSLYLHCDSAMSHYLKVLLDILFGAENFQNEIIWQRTSAHSDPHRFGRVTDSILFYAKDTAQMYFNPQYQEYDEEYLSKFYRYSDERGRYRLSDLTGPGVNAQDQAWRGYHPGSRGRSWSVPRQAVQALAGDGADALSTVQKLDLLHAHHLIHISGRGVPAFKRYLNTMRGVPLQNLWADILPLGPKAKEKNGYPTQKPQALLERIILCSSKEKNLVADFFCGSGTTLAAAQKLGRDWLGCDNNKNAISIVHERLNMI